MLARRGKRLVFRDVVQRVRQTASLRAKTAVRRTPADERRHEALARIAHAKRTMRKCFDFDAEFVRHAHQVLDFRKR